MIKGFGGKFETKLAKIGSKSLTYLMSTSFVLLPLASRRSSTTRFKLLFPLVIG